MEIKAVKFRKDGFYSQPFVFGGEEGPQNFDPAVRYRGSLQNYLIDTGDEVILVDTGLPAGTPEEVPDETSPLYTGKDICSYIVTLDKGAGQLWLTPSGRIVAGGVFVLNQLELAFVQPHASELVGLGLAHETDGHIRRFIAGVLHHDAVLVLVAQ